MKALRQQSGETSVSVEPRTKVASRTHTRTSRRGNTQLLRRTRGVTNLLAPTLSPHSKRSLSRRDSSRDSIPQTADAPLIYAVDDLPDITALYSALLGAEGYTVKAFSDRSEALSSLKAGGAKPDLLITDYRNLSKPFEQFISGCLEAHPAIRILIVSGFVKNDIQLSHVKNARFLQKPFTVEALLREVSCAFAKKV